MVCTVSSMLTTTPFFRPRESCEPMPITLRLPSLLISATSATIFDVPMSRPTTISLLSLLICLLSLRLARDSHRETIRIPQIHYRRPDRPFGDRFRINLDKARQPDADRRFRLLAADIDQHAVLQLQLPGQARRQRDLHRRLADRLDDADELAVVLQHFLRRALWPEQQRQAARFRLGHRGREDLAVAVDQFAPPLAPARHRLVFLDADFQPVRPLPPDIDLAHPGQLFQRAAYRFQIQAEEIALQSLRQHLLHLAALGVRRSEERRVGKECRSRW